MLHWEDATTTKAFFLGATHLTSFAKGTWSMGSSDEDVKDQRKYIFLKSNLAFKVVKSFKSMQASL